MSDYKLVPVQPTDEMTDVGDYARSCGCSSSGIYADMLAAAPDMQGEPDHPRLRQRFDEIEREICEGKHTASSVFTQMRTAVFYAAPQPAPDVSALVESLEPVIKADIKLPPLPKGDIAADTCPLMWVHTDQQTEDYAREAVKADRQQRGEQQPISHDWDDQDKCRRCGGRDWYASSTCSPKQQPTEQKEPDSLCVEDDGCPTEKAVLQRFWRKHHQPEPDVSALVEALESILRGSKLDEFGNRDNDGINSAVWHGNTKDDLRRWQKVASNALAAYLKGGEA